jgi:saccharopine dehydrogenase (NAD+, L-lysine-forming)
MVLGGYGRTGCRIAELLVRETDAHVVIAGRRPAEARSVADRIAGTKHAERVTAQLADAEDPALLEQRFREVDLVIVASSTSRHVDAVSSAALAAGIDYLDIQHSASKLRYLESIAGDIAERGSCFITEAGLHPGMPAALICFAAGFMNRIQRVSVASVMQVDWRELRISSATTEEFAREISSYRPMTLQQGEWVAWPWWRARRFAFGAPFGIRQASPMVLAELRQLPGRFPSLDEAGFYVGGFNRFVDYVAMPLAWGVQRVSGDRFTRHMGKLLAWGLRKFSRPPYGTVLVIEAKGWKKGRMVALRGTVRHDDAYTLTAIAVVACVLQYLKGGIRKPGLWYQALAVDPRRFLTDVERLGASVEYDLDVET